MAARHCILHIGGDWLVWGIGNAVVVSAVVVETSNSFVIEGLCYITVEAGGLVHKTELVADVVEDGSLFLQTSLQGSKFGTENVKRQLG